MFHDPIVLEIAILLAISVPLAALARRLGFPSILGMLLTGVLIGPFALGLVDEAESVERIAELGVVLILFFVGLEFPLARLRNLGAATFLGGTLQIFFTVALTAAAASMFFSGYQQPIFFGLLIAFSSTAVLIPLLRESGDLVAPYGQRTLGVLLFQDLAVIPVVLLIPALGSEGEGPDLQAILYRVALAIVGVILLVAIARLVVPRMMRHMSMARSQETFTSGIVVLVVLLIVVAERVGVSPALGAFAAGIVLAESDYIHEVFSTLRPFRDIFSTLFFTSIGMLLDPVYVMEHPLMVLAIVAGALVLKSIAAYPALRLSGALPRSAVRAALPLATVGEFSFIVAQAGRELNLVTPDLQQSFVATAVITLAIAPFLIILGDRIASKVRDPEQAREELASLHHETLEGHVVIIGYGLNGQNVARVLSDTSIRYMVIDEDARLVEEAREKGHDAIVADASSPDTLSAAGIDKAVAAVVAISDQEGTRRIVRLCRQLSPDLSLIVRTRYVSEVESLRDLGANVVIPEEFETSIEIATRILRMFHIPGNIIATQLRILRDETYRLLRDPAARAADGRRLSALIAAGTSELFVVMPDTWADGKRLGELKLEDHQVAMPALLRDGAPMSPPDLATELQPGDTLLLVGAHEDLNRAVARLQAPAADA